MLDRVRSLWTRGEPKGSSGPDQTSAAEPRNRQKNVKASAACIAAFAHLAKVSHMSEAALFEDMVAQRWEELHRAGRIDV
jgi:hypothetical protein